LASGYAYDAKGNTTLERRYLVYPTSNPSQYFDALYEYWPPSAFTPVPLNDRIKKITYPNGSITLYEYDALGNRTKETKDSGGLVLISEWTYDSQGHVLTAKDPNGHVTANEYDVYGNHTKTTDPEGHVTRYEYDLVGNLTKVIDGNNHATVYSPYDGMNRLLTETDPLGYTTEYQYNGLGQRIQVKKKVTLSPATYETTQYQYDNRDRLVQEIRDPLGLNLVTQYAYDGNDNRTQITDPRGKLTKYTYDTQNRLSKVEDALHNLTETRYDLVGNRVCAIDANLHYTFLEYDALNRPVKQTRKIGIQSCTTADGDDILTRTFYDSGSAIASIDCKNPQCAGPMPGSSSPAYTIDPDNKYAYFKYDAINRRVMTIRKVGAGDTADAFDGNDWSEITQYDATGNILARYDANGNATTSTYFDNNWLKTQANALAETTTYTYDGVGKVKTVHTPGGNTTTNTYDDRNELVQVDDSIGRVASYSYDGIGNRLTQCDGNNNCAGHQYDAVNRILSTTDALAQTTHHSYDADGNLVKTLDRDGKAVCYVYDAINRRVRQVQKIGDTDCNAGGGDGDANDVWTKTVYDAVGNVTELTTAKNNGGGTPTICNGGTPTADCETTRYTYDEVNRLVQEAYPLRYAGDTQKNTREFAYDFAGNLIQRTDQKNAATQYVYDDIYRLTQRLYATDPDDTFAYDVGGRMTQALRDGWLVTFSYDAANRVLQTTQNGQTVAYAYDIPHRQRTLSYPGGKTVVEQRDFRERNSALNAGAIATYTYDLGNRVTRRVYGNGTQAAYSYDANNRITGLNHTKADTSLIAGFSHAYDNEGNKQYEDKAHDPAYSEGYQYDDLYRLIDYKVGTLDLSGNVPLPLTQTQYDLDKLGNWVHKIKDGVTETRRHDAVNEIFAINGVPVLSDPNGNTSKDSAYQYRHDQENRLAQVLRNADVKTVGQYRYDALSRRVAKIADPVGGPSTPVETRYVYDDARIIEEQNTSGATLAAYAYGNYIDEVLSMDRAGQTYYYHQNALWSVEALTDGSANVVERVAYDAYGMPTITEETGVVLTNVWGAARSGAGNPWLFTGRQFEEESGLYFYRARYYDAGKERFLERDPKKISFRFPQINLYQYVGDNPLKYSDASGMTGCDCTPYYPGESDVECNDKTPIDKRLLMAECFGLCTGACKDRTVSYRTCRKVCLPDITKVNGVIEVEYKWIEHCADNCCDKPIRNPRRYC